MKPLAWLRGLREEFASSSPARQLGIIANVVGILGISVITVLSALSIQLSRTPPLRIAVILEIVSFTLLWASVVLAISGLLGFLVSALHSESRVVAAIHVLFQLALWLLALAAAIALLPDLVRSALSANG